MLTASISIPFMVRVLGWLAAPDAQPSLPGTRKSWSSGTRSRCCGVRSPARGQTGLDRAVLAALTRLLPGLWGGSGGNGRCVRPDR